MKNSSFAARVLNRTFYYGFSSILGKIVGFVMLPIYTNYLTPKDYGVAGFLIFYVSLSQIVLGAKLEQAISKYHYDKEEDFSLGTLLCTSTIFTIAVSSIPLCFSLIFSTQISTWLFDSPEYYLAVKIISLNILFSTLELYGLQYIKIKDLPKTYLILNLFKLVTQLSINVVLIVFMEKGILGVVVSSVTAAIALTLITGIFVFVKEANIGFNKVLAKKMFWYSAPLWVSGLLGLYSGSIHQVFIKIFSGLSDLGLYNLAATFGALVGTLAWTPFFNFWSVERYRIHKQDNAKRIFKNVFYLSAAISFFLSLGISVFSDPVIKIMAQSDFHNASYAVAPLTILTSVTFLGWYLNFSFLVTSNNKEIAINGIVYAILISVGLVLTIPKWGFIGAAYGLMLANIVNLHVIANRAKKYYDIGIKILYVDLMIALTILCYFGFTRVNNGFASPIAAFLVNAAIFLTAILAALIIIHLRKPALIKGLMSKSSS